MSNTRKLSAHAGDTPHVDGNNGMMLMMLMQAAVYVITSSHTGQLLDEHHYVTPTPHAKYHKSDSNDGLLMHAL